MGINVSSTGSAKVYDVELDDDDGRISHHRVTVPADLAGAGLPDVEHERLVRESFAFLLEREPPSAILPEFDLPVVARYFPDYPAELRRRLS